MRTTLAARSHDGPQRPQEISILHPLSQMTDQQVTPTPEPARRPAAITGLASGAILVSLFHLLKFIQVVVNWSVLANLDPQVSPAYLAGDGLVWFSAGGLLAWGLWMGRPWAKPATLITSAVYSLAFWIDRLWIASPDRMLRRWPVNLLYTLIGLGLILWILTRPASREYFKENPVKIT